MLSVMVQSVHLFLALHAMPPKLSSRRASNEEARHALIAPILARNRTGRLPRRQQGRSLYLRLRPGKSLIELVVRIHRTFTSTRTGKAGTLTGRPVFCRHRLRRMVQWPVANRRRPIF
jgi:hypothetical protein